MASGVFLPVCDLYTDGHVLHWIRGRKASQDWASWGRLAAVDNGVFMVEYLDRTARYRHHDTRAVEEIAKLGAKIRVSERFRVLTVHFDNERISRGFCIALENTTWTPCSYEPITDISPDSLAERLETRGGFSLGGSSVAGWS